MASALGALPTLSSSGAPALPGVAASAPRRRPRPQQPGMTSGTPDDGSGQGQPQQPQTFAQMQQAGVARPAPPTPQAPQTGAIRQYRGSQQASQVRGQLQGAVTDALKTPSRYDTSTFNTIRDSAYGDLSSQFAKIRDTTNTDLARRGLAASTFGANDLHDVDSAQSRAMSDLNAQLLKDAAATQASDRSAAYGMGSDLAGMAGSQDLAAYGANANATNQSFQNQLAQQLGLGQLGLSEGALTGSYGGADTLASRSLAQSGSQFQQQQDLAKQEVQNQASQFGQQFGLQQQQQDLAQQLGLGNLDLAGKSLTQSGHQFDTTQNTQAEQFKEQLAQQLGIAQMGDVTQNRALQASNQGSQNDFLLKILSVLGPGVDWSKYFPNGASGTGTTAATSAPPVPTPAPSAPIAKGPVWQQALDLLKQRQAQ